MKFTIGEKLSHPQYSGLYEVMAVDTEKSVVQLKSLSTGLVSEYPAADLVDFVSTPAQDGEATHSVSHLAQAVDSVLLGAAKTAPVAAPEAAQPAAQVAPAAEAAPDAAPKRRTPAEIAADAREELSKKMAELQARYAAKISKAERRILSPSDRRKQALVVMDEMRLKVRESKPDMVSATDDEIDQAIINILDSGLVVIDEPSAD